VRALSFVRATVAELVSLLVDDVLTFVGAVVGLLGTYVVAHQVSDRWAGFVMYAVVWAFLALSLTRAARR
jgi:hypothetical protein